MTLSSRLSEIVALAEQATPSDWWAVASWKPASADHQRLYAASSPSVISALARVALAAEGLDEWAFGNEPTDPVIYGRLHDALSALLDVLTGGEPK